MAGPAPAPGVTWLEEPFWTTAQAPTGILKWRSCGSGSLAIVLPSTGVMRCAALGNVVRWDESGGSAEAGLLGIPLSCLPVVAHDDDGRFSASAS